MIPSFNDQIQANHQYDTSAPPPRRHIRIYNVIMIASSAYHHLIIICEKIVCCGSNQGWRLTSVSNASPHYWGESRYWEYWSSVREIPNTSDTVRVSGISGRIQGPSEGVQGASGIFWATASVELIISCWQSLTSGWFPLCHLNWEITGQILTKWVEAGNIKFK